MKNIIKSMGRQGIFAFVMIFALVAAVSALSIPPVIQISATPNPAGVTTTIVAVAVDLSGSGIAWVKVYEDGAKVKECSTSTCVYVAVHPSAATHSYYAKTSDNGGRETTSSTTNVVFTNVAPVLNSIGERNVTNNSLLQFQISGYDYNNDVLTYSAAGNPLSIGASFNPATRTFSWTPTTAQIGTHYVNFSVSDGYLADSEVVTINVLSDYVNYAPVLAAIGDKTVEETELLQFTISATDANADPLTYSALNIPAGAIFNATTRTFSWTPSLTQAGVYFVNFSVTDGSLADSEVVTITVLDYDINHAPVLDAIGSKSLLEGQLLEFAVDASDADGDTLTYSALNIPAGAIFNATTKIFSWIPDFTQSGVYFVNFSVSDGLLADSEVVTITVTDAVDNEAPKYSNLVENPESPAGYGEYAFEFNATWTDNFAVVGAWIEFDGVNYSASKNGDVYSFNIDYLAIGNYSYRWFATDMAGNYNSTGTFIYEIVKGTPSLSIEMLPSGSVVNGTQTNVTGLGCPSQLVCTLYRDGVEVNNTDIQTLDIGSYTYIFNTTGNENYSSASVSRLLRIIGDGSDDDNEGDDDNDTDIIVIDNDDFINGISTWLDIGDKLKFTFCGAPYYLKLKDVDYDDKKAYLQLTPSLMNFVLEEDEREEVDLNGDGIKDLLIRIDDVQNDRAKVYVKRLSSVCETAQKAGSTLVSDGAENLGAKSSNTTTIWGSLSFLFLLGIMLLLLAILLWLLLGMKRKKRVQPVNNFNNQ